MGFGLLLLWRRLLSRRRRFGLLLAVGVGLRPGLLRLLGLGRARRGRGRLGLGLGFVAFGVLGLGLGLGLRRLGRRLLRRRGLLLFVGSRLTRFSSGLGFGILGRALPLLRELFCRFQRDSLPRRAAAYHFDKLAFLLDGFLGSFLGRRRGLSARRAWRLFWRPFARVGQSAAHVPAHPLDGDAGQGLDAVFDGVGVRQNLVAAKVNRLKGRHAAKQRRNSREIVAGELQKPKLLQIAKRFGQPVKVVAA